MSIKSSTELSSSASSHRQSSRSDIPANNVSRKSNDADKNLSRIKIMIDSGCIERNPFIQKEVEKFATRMENLLDQTGSDDNVIKEILSLLTPVRRKRKSTDAVDQRPSSKRICINHDKVNISATTEVSLAKNLDEKQDNENLSIKCTVIAQSDNSTDSRSTECSPVEVGPEQPETQPNSICCKLCSKIFSTADEQDIHQQDHFPKCSHKVRNGYCIRCNNPID